MVAEWSDQYNRQRRQPGGQGKHEGIHQVRIRSKKTVTNQSIPLIAPKEFIHSMRHGGYRSPASAMAELVDNAIEAHATLVDVTLTSGSDESPTVKVLDNGIGMTPTILQRCLQFGGTTRFNSRNGLGRFGLGLPASSLSYARRVNVYSWRRRTRVLSCHLDVDEVWQGATYIPELEKVKYPNDVVPYDTGTLVVWEKCDGLNLTRLRYVLGRIRLELGRRFRNFIWDGVEIRVNGEAVTPIDPLLRSKDSSGVSSAMYGPEIRLSVRNQTGTGNKDTGDVVIKFAELPVSDWYSLSPAEKRKKGITRAAGVSVIRNRREVDYGWYFMGGKRRENYDDWWRCEVEFNPVLDETFGVTHTKQQIRPSDALIEALTPIIEPVARVLSRRAREAHQNMASKEQDNNPIIAFAEKVNDVLPNPGDGLGPLSETLRLEITCERRSTPELYSPVAHNNGRLALTFNSSHVYYKRIHSAATQGDPIARKIEEYMETLLLAATKAESVLDEADLPAVERFRIQWGKILSCYMNR